MGQAGPVGSLSTMSGYKDVYEDPPVELLHLAGCTFAVVRGDGWSDELLARLGEQLSPTTLLVRLADGDSIEALDEAMMAEHGWVRHAAG